jgi:twinkle protein
MLSSLTATTAIGLLDGNTMTTDALTWLSEVRGLDAELCSKMGLTAKQRRDGSAAIAIPYRHNGEVYGHKMRAVETKEFMFHPSGVVHRLFNVDILADETLTEEPVVITEGELDTLSVMQAGFIRVVSIPDGWTDGLEGGDGAKIKPLLDEEKRLRNSPCVIVAGDNDSTGQSFVRAVNNLLKGHPVRYCRWPDGCKDPNDVLRKHGEDELARCINSASLMDPSGGMITGFSDLPPLGENLILRPGIDWLDKAVAFEVGAMSVGTGTPGSGKSTFATYIANRLVRNHQIRCGMAAFETHPYAIRDHLSRLNTGKPFDMLSKEDRDMLYDALDTHWRLVHRTFEGETTHNLGWLENMVHALAVRDQCKMIVIDPWNELEHMPEPGESMTAYINFALQRIRQMAERFDCHICLISHPKKMSTEGNPKAPTGYDIADSAAFFNKPSLGFTVHQVQMPDEEPFVELRTWKVRNVQRYGFNKGRIEMQFDDRGMVYRKRDFA